LENERLKTKLGEMLLDRELLEAKVAALETGRPSARRRSKR
jgi:transposase